MYNKLTEMLLANGLKQIYAYDKNDRPTQIGAVGVGSLMSLNYAYDPSGNVMRLNGDYYEYDGLNRLVWAGNISKVQATSGTSWGRGTAWSYDAAGNMTSKSYYANGQLLPEMGVTMTYDLADRLLTKTQNGQITTYTHDSAGSRLSKVDGSNAWYYDYDSENRMTQVKKNGATIEENAFDGGGMRVKKVNGGKTYYYVYEGSNPILEYNATENKYTYFIFAGSNSVAEERDGKKIFYHRDHLGSTRAMTDSDKKLVGLCKYDPWGNMESTNEYDEGVINGDMEMKDSLGNVSRWISSDASLGGDCTVASGEGINGSTALRIYRTAGSTAYWSLPNLFASPDTDYELTGCYTSNGNVKAQLVYKDSEGNVLAVHETGALAAETQWKTFSLASHAPAGAATMEIRLSADSTAGTVARFDGTRLKVPGLEGKYDFTGKREDEDTGLLYFGARYYDPETCRFISMDPSKDGLNWWVYCRDNPINRFDQNGRKSEVLATYTYKYTHKVSPAKNLVAKVLTAILNFMYSKKDYKGIETFLSPFMKNRAYDMMLGPLGCGFSKENGYTYTQETTVNADFGPDGKAKSITVTTTFSWSSADGKDKGEFTHTETFTQSVALYDGTKGWTNEDNTIFYARFEDLIADLEALYGENQSDGENNSDGENQSDGENKSGGGNSGGDQSSGENKSV